MSDLNQHMAERYRNNFLKEIEEQAEMGEWVKLCMQCGLCSGSCPTHFHDGWDHAPHEIFMLIRAGKRDEVLQSQGMWMCTSCYNCYVRCPRKVPVTHVMHDHRRPSPPSIFPRLSGTTAPGPAGSTNCASPIPSTSRTVSWPASGSTWTWPSSAWGWPGPAA
ncbi:MAG: heterodisulfide reductase subunit C [bacterium]|nr:MAG: heterodisulfide reductase subunit C [bacterium]